MLKYFLSIERFYSVSFPCGSAGKGSARNAGDLGLIPGQEARVPHASRPIKAQNINNRSNSVACSIKT